MNIPTYYTLLDWTEGLGARIKAKLKIKVPLGAKPARGSREGLMGEAMERYGNIVGRFDTTNRVESRELLPPADADEEEMLKLLGAEEKDGEWFVPDTITDLEQFADWWPEVPEDLRDETPRWLQTKNGKSIESYVTVEDRAKGDDSTATVLVYGGFVAIAALCFFLAKINFLLVLPALLLFVPFTVTMAQAEGVGESVKCLALIGLGPLLVASTLGASAGILPFLADGASAQDAAGVLAEMAGGWIMMLAFIPIFLLVSLFISFIAWGLDKNKEEAIIGGTFAKMKSILKWTGIYFAAFILVMILPFALKPIVPFLLASLYPMVYANANFVKRGKHLKVQSMDTGANLGTQGGLSKAYLEPKKLQAARALKDKSPKFIVGEATGVMTAKHLSDAPDAGKMMVITSHDMSQHVLVFGETGSGKTETQGKKFAAQWIAAGAGGMLVLDGKGALPGDIRELIDVMVEPGVNFAPYQGLDGRGIALAYNAVASANGGAAQHKIWESGANQFMDRSCKLFEALHNHEHNYKNHAGEMAALKELEIDRLVVEIKRRELHGEDVGEKRTQLEAVRGEYDKWASARDAARKWRWNVDTHLKVMSMMNDIIRTPDGKEKPGSLFQDAMAWLGHGVPAKVRAANPGRYHPEIGTGGLLDGAIDYVVRIWIGVFKEQQRSSFYLNVVDRVLPLTVDPFTIGESGVHWKTLETGLDVGVCLKGQSVGVYLPEEKHQDSGKLISALVNQRVYGAIALRGGENRDWKEKGESTVLVIMDEFQDLVSDVERNLLPKARSLGMRALFMTQEIDAVINKFDSDNKALQFCNTFQSVICLRSSKATHDYMDTRLGHAPLVKFKQPTRGVDYKAAVRMHAEGPLNDLDHPHRAVMRRIERAGGAKFMFQSKVHKNQWRGPRIENPDDMDVARGIIVPMGGHLEEGPLLTPAEHRELVRFGYAIAYLRRAGEPRIDIIKTLVTTQEEMDAAIAARSARKAQRELASLKQVA